MPAEDYVILNSLDRSARYTGNVHIQCFYCRQSEAHSIDMHNDRVTHEVPATRGFRYFEEAAHGWYRKVMYLDHRVYVLHKGDDSAAVIDDLDGDPLCCTDCANKLPHSMARHEAHILSFAEDLQVRQIDGYGIRHHKEG